MHDFKMIVRCQMCKATQKSVKAIYQLLGQDSTLPLLFLRRPETAPGTVLAARAIPHFLLLVPDQT